MQLTTLLHLVQRVRMSGAVLLLPYTISWHGEERHFYIFNNGVRTEIIRAR